MSFIVMLVCVCERVKAMMKPQFRPRRLSIPEIKEKYGSWVKPCRRSFDDMIHLLHEKFTLVPFPPDKLKAATEAFKTNLLDGDWGDRNAPKESDLDISGYLIVRNEKSEPYYDELPAHVPK